MIYNFEALTSKNIHDLVFLYKAVFGNKVTDEFVLKKFDTSYLINKYFGHLAYFNEKPVAFHGAIPVLMKYNNKTEIAAQYGDAMTLKNHTGKGLFTKLGKLTDAQLIKADIKFIWGFPNQNSEYGYLNKLDWQYEERMQGFKLRTSKLQIEKFSKKIKFTSKIYQNHIEKTFEKYKVNYTLKGSVFNNLGIVSTSRASSFYRYRSFTNNFTIKIENVFFWVKINNGLHIGDIEANSKNDFFIALERLKKIATKIGVYEIIFQASPNTQIIKFMDESEAEKFESWVVGFKNISSDFPLEKLKFTFGDLDTF